MCKILITIIIIFFSLTGCSDKKVLSDKIVELEGELSILQSQFDKLSEDYQCYRTQVSSKKNDELDVSLDHRIYDNDSIFKWFRIEKWDKIHLIEYYPDYDVETPKVTEFETNDPKLLGIRPDSFIYGIIRYGVPTDPGNGGRYTYEFTKGTETYAIDIYDAHTFEYEGVFYSCIGDLSTLSNAFFKTHIDWLDVNNYLDFIYNSPIVTSDKIHKYARLGLSKNRSIALSMSNFVEIDEPIKDSQGELHEILTYYYNGETMQMEVYELYLKINFRNKVIWLEGNVTKWVEQPALSILWIYSEN